MRNRKMRAAMDNLSVLVDELMDEFMYCDAMARCDELVKRFTSGPLHKKCNVRILQDM